MIFSSQKNSTADEHLSKITIPEKKKLFIKYKSYLYCIGSFWKNWNFKNHRKISNDVVDVHLEKTNVNACVIKHIRCELKQINIILNLKLFLFTKSLQMMIEAVQSTLHPTQLLRILSSFRMDQHNNKQSEGNFRKSCWFY